jgi:hypothetical protein
MHMVQGLNREGRCSCVPSASKPSGSIRESRFASEFCCNKVELDCVDDEEEFDDDEVDDDDDEVDDDEEEEEEEDEEFDDDEATASRF